MSSQFVNKAFKVIIDTGRLTMTVTKENAVQIRDLIAESHKDGTIKVTHLKCGNNVYVSFRDSLAGGPKEECKIIPFPKRKAA